MSEEKQEVPAKKVDNTNCCVFGCHTNRKKQKNVSFHLFPSENSGYVYVDNKIGTTVKVPRKKAWEIALSMEKPATTYMRVCAKHFTPQDFLKYSFCGSKKPRLKKIAVPSKNLPQRNDKKENRNRGKVYTKRKRLTPDNSFTVHSTTIDHTYAASAHADLQSNAEKEYHAPEAVFIPVKSEFYYPDNECLTPEKDPLPQNGAELTVNVQNDIIMKNVANPNEMNADKFFIKEEFADDVCSDQELKYEKPYFKSIKCFLLEDNRLAEVCRICFRSLLDTETIKLYEDSSNPTKEMISSVLPDLNLQLYPNVVICTKCVELVEHSYQLKQMCSSTEEKLRRILQEKKGVTNQDADLVIIDKTAEENISPAPRSHNQKLELTNSMLDNLLLSYKQQKLPKVTMKKKRVYNNDLAVQDKIEDKNESTSEMQNFEEELTNSTLDNISPFRDKPSKFFVSGEVNCNESFSIESTQLLLNNQEKTSDHDYVSPGVCEKCGKIFLSWDSLQQHLATHTSASVS